MADRGRAAAGPQVSGRGARGRPSSSGIAPLVWCAHGDRSLGDDRTRHVQTGPRALGCVAAAPATASATIALVVRGQPGLSVLQGEHEITAAHGELVRLGIEFESTSLLSRIRRRVRRMLPGDAPSRSLIWPDPLKSWDVLLTTSALAAGISPSDSVLDLGSVGSGTLPALQRLGYTNLYGIDLDPAVTRTQGSESVELVVGDMMNTPWPAESFAAITAISVIEHGLHADRLLSEVARLLKPGGLFVFSTDYWPDKVDTDDVRPFGMSWMIFDTQEIRRFLSNASAAGLKLEAEITDLDRPPSPPVSWSGRAYTFLHGVLRRE